MIEFEKNLEKAGLAGNESKIYLELLKKGSLSANEIAKRIGMDRTLTYTVLNNLIAKGLVNYIIKENKKFFDATSPENLLNPIKEKEAFIKDLIPLLKNIEKTKETVQEVNIYVGKEGLRVLMNEISKSKSFCSFGATGRAYDKLYELPRLVKEMLKKGLIARIITNHKYKRHEMIKIKNIKFRFLDVKSEVTTTILKDKLAIHLVLEKPLIIIIKNKEIAESYQNHFELLWKLAKEQ